MAELLVECENICVPYIDDIAIFLSDWTEHANQVYIIQKILPDAKLKINHLMQTLAEYQ